MNVSKILGNCAISEAAVVKNRLGYFTTRAVISNGQVVIPQSGKRSRQSDCIGSRAHLFVAFIEYFSRRNNREKLSERVPPSQLICFSGYTLALSAAACRLALRVDPSSNSKKSKKEANIAIDKEELRRLPRERGKRSAGEGNLDSRESIFAPHLPLARALYEEKKVQAVEGTKLFMGQK